MSSPGVVSYLAAREVRVSCGVVVIVCSKFVPMATVELVVARGFFLMGEEEGEEEDEWGWSEEREANDVNACGGDVEELLSTEEDF